MIYCGISNKSGLLVKKQLKIIHDVAEILSIFYFHFRKCHVQYSAFLYKETEFSQISTIYWSMYISDDIAQNSKVSYNIQFVLQFLGYQIKHSDNLKIIPVFGFSLHFNPTLPRRPPQSGLSVIMTSCGNYVFDVILYIAQLQLVHGETNWNLIGSHRV